MALGASVGLAVADWCPVVLLLLLHGASKCDAVTGPGDVLLEEMEDAWPMHPDWTPGASCELARLPATVC